MILESLAAVTHTHTHTHTPRLYKIIKNEINNKEIDKRGLCQYVNRHK